MNELQQLIASRMHALADAEGRPMTIRAVARASGLSAEFVRKCLHGLRDEIPRRLELAKLAKGLQVDYAVVRDAAEAEFGYVPPDATVHRMSGATVYIPDDLTDEERKQLEFAVRVILSSRKNQS